MRRLFNVCVMAAALSAGLSACSTTGQHFNPCGAARLTPEVSTYIDAVNELGSVPYATYIQDDGSFIAHWYMRDSVVTDALYLHHGVMLVFGADGSLLRAHNGRPAKYWKFCGVADQAAV